MKWGLKVQEIKWCMAWSIKFLVGINNFSLQMLTNRETGCRLMLTNSRVCKLPGVSTEIFCAESVRGVVFTWVVWINTCFLWGWWWWWGSKPLLQYTVSYERRPAEMGRSLTLANLWSVWVSTYFTNVIKNEFLTGACDFTDMLFVHMIALICFVYNRGASVTVLLPHLLPGIH